jgi:hypothetical protein
MAGKIQVPDRDGRDARNQKLEKSIQRGQEQRRTEMAKRPVVQPSTNALPALSNAPKVALFPTLKK